MDIRSRLKNLIIKDDGLGADKVDPHEATTGTAGFSQSSDSREFADDLIPDREVIEGIEEVYFSNIDEFDSSQHELDKLPEKLDIESLDKYRNTLRRQQHAVSRELSNKILQNQGCYMRELMRVQALVQTLKDATETCKDGRGNLSKAQTDMAHGGLELLAKNRRKVLLQGILKSLRFIKTLQETDVRLKELLEEGSFANAIQICLEYRKAAVSFNQYTCISELSKNLLDILEQIKEQLDVGLSQLCFMFDETKYGQIQKAYRLLGNTQIAMDAMSMHFVNTVNKVAVNTIYEVLEGIGIRGTDTSFPSLCVAVPREEFQFCLVRLCTNFWTIMYSYREMMQWHKNEDKSKQDESQEAIPFAYDDATINSKLEQGLDRIWHDIQLKTEAYVLSSNFAEFKYDELIKVLDIVNQLITIGEEFSSRKSQILQNSIRTQTVNYFKAYHKKTMDQLKMFFENEAWVLCPVKEDFSYLDLREFWFMRGHGMKKKPGSTGSLASTGSGKAYFGNDAFSKTKTPFDIMLSCNESSDTLPEEELFIYYSDDDEDDDDVPDELKRDFVDENTGEETHTYSSSSSSNKMARRLKSTLSENTPIITNTALDVLRSFGKYMQMITVLKPIAFDVVTFMTQLFDYYLYTVFTFFSEGSDYSMAVMELAKDSKLNNCLARVHNSIILRDGDTDSMKVPPPHLSPTVDLESAEQLYGFTHRLVGVESLVFLSKQLKLVYHKLELWIPVNKQAFLGQFYSQTVDIVADVRGPVYKPITDATIDYGPILQMMYSVKWDIKDIRSDHSDYISTIVKEYKNLQIKVYSFSSVIPLPLESLLEFWRNVVTRTSRVFVEGFSNVKKCSTAGRALMLLDYQNFAMKIEDIARLKPIPERMYVVDYINAFYLQEAELENWLKTHTEYTPKQLSNLVTCGTGSHIGKKMKEKFLGLLNEIESSPALSVGKSNNVASSADSR